MPRHLIDIGNQSINGDLTVFGTISASQYLGLPTTETLNSVTTRGNTTTNSIKVGTLTANNIQLDANPTIISFKEGQIFYDNNWKTVAAHIENDVTIQIGQEDLNYVYNNSDRDIFDGQAVYVTGSGSDGINVVTDTVALAKADNTATSTTVGVATCHIPIGSYGFVTSRGKINGFDTTQLGTDGGLLYLSPLSAGTLTPTIPESPYPRIIMGRLLINDPLSGRISIYPEKVPDAAASVLASVSVNQYLTQTTSTVNSAYRELSYATTLSSLQRSVTVDATPALSATILGDQFLYSTGIGILQIPAGTWDFNIPAYVSSTASVTRIKMEVYMYHADTSTTKLFEAFSGEINDTILADQIFSYVSPEYTVLTTDRLMVKLYATTTRNTPTTLYYVLGDGNGAFMTTPLQLRHNLLRDFNEDPSIQHMNASEATVVRALVNGNISDNLTVSSSISASGSITGSTLSVAGVSLGYTSETSNYTISPNDYTIHVTANSVIVQLPDAINIVGKVYNVKNTGNGVVTLSAHGSQIIDDYNTVNISRNDSLMVQSTNANWIIL